MKCNEGIYTARAGRLVWAFIPILVAIGFGFALVGNTEAADRTAQPCNLATLSGNYGTTLSGWSLDQGVASSPTAAIGLWTFDGGGHVSGSFYINAGPGRGKGTFSGSYKVRSNCTGTLSADIGEFTFVIAQQGNEFFAIQTNDSLAAIITGKKQ